MGSVLKVLNHDEYGIFKDTKGDQYRIGRDEIFVSTKNGYVPDDSDNGVSAQLLVDQLVESGKVTKEDVASGIHCMHPNFLAHSLL